MITFATIMKKSIFITEFVLLVCACTNNGKMAANINRLAFDSVVVDSTYALTQEHNSPKCEVSISILYVKDHKNRIINHTLLESGIFTPDYLSLSKEKNNIKLAVHSFVNKYISDYKKDYGELYRQDKKNGDLYNCSYKIKTQTQDGAENILVYIASIYSYSGGSHGTSQTFVRNINIRNGHLITLNDIFVPGYEPTLKGMIVEKIYNKFKVNGFYDFKKQYRYTDNNIYIPDNFILDEDKITFIYCENEIAPHRIGEIRIDIDKNYMNKILR